MSVGIDTNYNNFSFGNNNIMNFQNPLNMKGLNNTNLFNFGNTGNNYDDDFLMPESLKSSVFSNVSNNQVQNSASLSFQNNQETTTMNTQTQPLQQVEETTNIPDGLTMPQNQNNIIKRFDRTDSNTAQTEKGNSYTKTDAFKKSGVVLGLLAPVAGKLIQLCKGGKFSELFKFKQIAIACPVVGLAGLAIGSLIDSYVNSQRAKAADEAQQIQLGLTMAT